MKLELQSRRDQFSYFLGYVDNAKENQLNDVLDWYSTNCNIGLSPDQIFDYCPFNDDMKQLLRSFHIYKDSKKSDFVNAMIAMVGEFVFLVADLVPACCGDGRLFYCLSDSKIVCMECDRCNQVYDLHGDKILGFTRHKMVKSEFIETFPQVPPSEWMYHEKLRG